MAKGIVNKIIHLQAVNELEIKQGLDQLITQGAESIMLLCCDTKDDLSFFNRLLPQYQTEIFGGVFPAIGWQQEIYDSGCLLIGLSIKANCSLNKNVSEPNECEPEIRTSSNHSLLVFVDGLSSHIEQCIHALYDWVGSNCTVFGGGAGSLDFTQKPCVISNQGIFADAFLIVSLPIEINLGIAHGWQQISGPCLVTKTDKNRIIELNYQPAFEVYREQIQQYGNTEITPENFFHHAKNYPLGLSRLDDDILIRDPIKVEGTDIICVGNVPENTMLYLLTGNNEQLIQAAKDSVTDTRIKTDLIEFEGSSQSLCYSV